MTVDRGERAEVRCHYRLEDLRLVHSPSDKSSNSIVCLVGVCTVRGVRVSADPRLPARVHLCHEGRSGCGEERFLGNFQHRRWRMLLGLDSQCNGQVVATP